MVALWHYLQVGSLSNPVNLHVNVKGLHDFDLDIFHLTSLSIRSANGSGDIWK